MTLEGTEEKKDKEPGQGCGHRTLRPNEEELGPDWLGASGVEKLGP